MNRVRTYFAAAVAAIILSLAVAACSTQAKSTTDSPADAPEAISITTAVVESRPLDRFLRVTGSLTADEQAEVSAETSGRVIATPVERGTRVAVVVFTRSDSPAASLPQADRVIGTAARIAADELRSPL